MTSEPQLPGDPGTGTAPPPVPGAQVPVDAAEQRIDASIVNWKRKLLDFSKRNRALNFRVNKVSTVAIVDEQPAEVFRQLALRGRNMRFKAAPEEEAPAATEPPAGTPAEAASTPAEPEVVAPTTPVPTVDGLEEDEEDMPVGADFVPYDPVSLGERHTDEWLQTASVPEALDRSLRRLEEQARAAIEEQGVNTLFLALGMLHYRESRDSQETLRAPLVLLPVA
ncbi:MAG: DUF4011 domain-containing protein, partial [Gemmatimonadetes bacterium]|nr:DUF4011 domain-containing protein [Gemmatimonadota bacterium]